MLPQNCTKRKHEYRIHELLSNGQWLNLFFQKHCNETGIAVWTMGLCISPSVKEANRWFNKSRYKLNNVQTGRCGLEGLTKALRYVLDFRDSMPEKAELHIEWSNDKRKSVYGRLLKYDFFDSGEDFYYGRNMNFWYRR